MNKLETLAEIQEIENTLLKLIEKEDGTIDFTRTEIIKLLNEAMQLEKTINNI